MCPLAQRVQVGRDGRHLIQPGFAELALDIVFGREAESTVRLQADVRSLPRRIGRQQLRHIGFGAACMVSIEQRRRLESHQIRRLNVHIGARDRELNPLISADRTIKYHALLGVR